jgi:hypothetical protein
MNFLPGKKYRIPSRIFVKKMFCAKKVTNLPDLTVFSISSTSVSIGGIAHFKN